MSVQISQKSALPTRKDVDREDALIIVAPKKGGARHLAKLAYGQSLARQIKRGGAAANSELNTTLANARDTRAAVGLWDPALSSYQRLTKARALVAATAARDAAGIAVVVIGFDEQASLDVAEAIVSAGLARAAAMPNFQSEHKAARLKRIRVYGVESSDKFARSHAEAAGNALARELAILPPNKLTPAIYCDRVKALAKEEGIQYSFINEAALAKLNAGAFLAVSQGSPTRDAGIVHLKYRPRSNDRRAPIALVGKGICFDTGGVNLKPHQYMLGMHGDMQGSAVALGTLLALTRMGVDYPVDCWLALARNHIGERAYIPNDVVTASDGTTIEVIHTDAEGRMVLSDTLVQVRKSEPLLAMDFATLTGACVGALGKRYSGCFTNDPDLDARVVAAGVASGERVWAFPMDEDFDRELKSDVADTKQCAPGGSPDHILAARFLRKFIGEETPWVHIDLSAGDHKGGLGHVPTEQTGFGVRLACQFLIDDVIANV